MKLSDRQAHIRDTLNIYCILGGIDMEKRMQLISEIRAQQDGEVRELSDDICTHEGTKIYSHATFASMPPQRPWICSKCGAQGNETIGEYKDPFEYDKEAEKWKEQQP